MYHFASATGFVSNPILHRNHTYYGFQNYVDTTWLQVSIPPAPVFYSILTFSYYSSQIFKQFYLKQGLGAELEHMQMKRQLLLFIMWIAEIKHGSSGMKTSNFNCHAILLTPFSFSTFSTEDQTQTLVHTSQVSALNCTSNVLFSFITKEFPQWQSTCLTYFSDALGSISSTKNRHKKFNTPLIFPLHFWFGLAF